MKRGVVIALYECFQFLSPIDMEIAVDAHSTDVYILYLRKPTKKCLLTRPYYINYDACTSDVISMSCGSACLRASMPYLTRSQRDDLAKYFCCSFRYLVADLDSKISLSQEIFSRWRPLSCKDQTCMKYQQNETL